MNARVTSLGRLSLAIGIWSAACSIVQAAPALKVLSMASPPSLNANLDEWQAAEKTTLPLSGRGGPAEAELRAAVHGDMFYLLAIWEDDSKNDLHKPLEWNETLQKYKKAKEKEDRFALSLAMSGEFSANKLSGAAFEADVWHWKAARSNPVGLAHDKMWKVAREAFEDGESHASEDGSEVYLNRPSDEGGRIYKPAKHDSYAGDRVSSYDVDGNVEGSIADIQAHGEWRDGKWYLVLARKLDTGHSDDATIPAAGEIDAAIAVFDGVDGDKHAVSEKLTILTR